MEVERAFEILGLPLTASKEDVQEAYQRLAKKVHPDTGGDNEEMALVNAARDVALRFIATSRALALRRSLDVIEVRPTQMAYPLLYAEQAKSVENLIRSHQMSRYHQLRYVSIFSGVLAGAATFIATQYGEAGLPFVAAFGPMTGLLAAFALASTWRLTVMDAAISALGAEFRDKNLMVSLLRDLASLPESLLERGQGSRGSFRAEEFRRKLDEWRWARLRKGEVQSAVPIGIARFIRTVGIEDSARLILAIGLETGVLEELEVSDDLGYPMTTYAIRRARREPSDS